MKRHPFAVMTALALFCLFTASCATSDDAPEASEFSAFSLSSAQQAAVLAAAQREVDKSILSDAPLRLENLRARKTVGANGIEYIELCAKATSGKIAGLLRLEQYQWFYGTFPSLTSTSFSIEVPRTDAALIGILAKCHSRGLKD